MGKIYKFVIASEARQSMALNIASMDRHGRRPRDDENVDL